MSNRTVRSIRKCSACGADHAKVDFHPTTMPVIVKDKEYHWWGKCPINGGTIYLRGVETDGETNNG